MSRSSTAGEVVVLLPSTPPDYHRIVSPTLKIPTDPKVSIPVGLLACQRDPLLRELISTVVSCQPSQSPPPPSKQRAKKDKATTAATEPLVQVILHDTILFPEGGGQPHDTGIFTSADGELWDVVDVKRFGGQAVHYVRVGERGVDAALKAFTPGSLVNIGLGEAGLNRRLDHMCMHTSQHLLSAVLDIYNLPTLSWSMTPYPAPSYVEIPRALSTEEIVSVQQKANALVFEGRRVYIEVEELDETAKTRYDGPSVGIPADYTGGVKRTVVIDGVDRSHCCGTQMPTLHNLQLFLLPNMDSLARAGSSSARLYFLAGPRLIAYLGSTYGLLNAAAASFSCGLPAVPERVEQVIEDRKRATKRVDDLEAELAAAIAKEMIAPFQSGDIVLHRHRIDDSTNPLVFLSTISHTFSNELASRAEQPSHLVVLTSSPSAQTARSTTVVMIFSSDEKKVKEVGDVLKTKLGVKGGGKGTKWSGKFVGVWKQNKEGAIVQEAIKA